MPLTPPRPVGSLRHLASSRPITPYPGASCARSEGSMTTPLLQACWAGAVTLGLYAFYSSWEASRADLAATFRHMAPGLPGSRRGDPEAASHRARARWAGTAALLLSLGCLAWVL